MKYCVVFGKDTSESEEIVNNLIEISENIG